MREMKLYPVNEYLQKTRPYAAKYAQLYGTWGLMSEDWPVIVVQDKGFKNSEEVYKKCLEEGKTWKELLGYRPEMLDGLTL